MYRPTYYNPLRNKTRRTLDRRYYCLKRWDVTYEVGRRGTRMQVCSCLFFNHNPIICPCTVSLQLPKDDGIEEEDEEH